MNKLGLNFLDLGDSDKLPIILIHGMALDQTMWTPQIPVLKEHYRVLTYDIRGHGLSEVGDAQYTYKMFADDLKSLMDYLEMDQAVLCGLSMGGAIVLRAYDMYPHRIKAMILSDARNEADSNETKYWRENSIESIKKDGLENFADEFVGNIFCQFQFQEASGSGGVNSKHRLIIFIRGISQPLSSSQMMHDEIVNSEFKIIPKAGHMSNLENLEEFNHNLLEFLGKIEF